MLANAQQDMEVNLAKMQLNKKIALTKSNEDKSVVLKKQNDELGYMFVPTQVILSSWSNEVSHDKISKELFQISVDLIQGKTAGELSSKVDRASMMIVEVMGSGEFCA